MSAEHTEVRTHVCEDGTELQVKIYYDEKGEPWAYQDVTERGVTTVRPFRPEDREPPRLRPNGEPRWIDTLPDPDEVVETVHDDGTVTTAYIMYNHDPDAPTLEDIMGNILRHHYDTASRMFGIYIPALEGHTNGK